MPAQEEPSPVDAERILDFHVNLIGHEVAKVVAAWPFQRLAAGNHPAWMPPEDKIEMLAGHVENGGNELLEKFLPMAMVKYASMFPATFAMLQAFAGVMMMQMFAVQRIKMAEARAAAQAQDPGKVVTIPAQPVPEEDGPFAS